MDSSCSSEELGEVKRCLQSCMDDSTLQELPLLVLCNKQDLSNAKTPQSVSISSPCEKYSIEKQGVYRIVRLISQPRPATSPPSPSVRILFYYKDKRVNRTG